MEESTQTFDDGSTLTLDGNGDIIGFTNSTDTDSGSDSVARSISNMAGQLGTSAFNAIKNKFVDAKTGDVNWGLLAGLGGGLAGLLGFGNSPSQPVGYTKPVPEQTMVRQEVPGTYDPARVPGSGGQQYFTDAQFVTKTGTTPEAIAADAASLEAAKTAAGTQVTGLAALNTANPAQRANTGITYAPLAPAKAAPAVTPAPKGASDVINTLPVPKYDVRGNVIPSGVVPPETKTTPITRAAHGGLMGLKKGTYLQGNTDGMADKIPARIGKHQEARLSHGEFVIPADVVGHLGNGNSDAGAQRLYAMMDKIRKARTGNSKQGKQINPDKFLLA
jgi:hypothetical protein